MPVRARSSLVLLLPLAVLLSDPAGAAVSGPRHTKAAAADPALEARIARLLASMTLEQKVGQMTQAEIGSITPEELTRHRVGSVLNGGGSSPGGRKHAGAADWRALAQRLDAAALAVEDPVKIPLLWGTDAVHGHNNVFGATLYPHHIGLGATRDAALVEAIGAATARAVRATGIAWTFAPTLAVAQDPRWGRTYESFSDDPQLVATLGAAMVRGLQRGLGQGGGVVATAKHFLGDGGTQGGRDQGVTLATRAELLARHLPPYRAALAAGVQTVMASFSGWHERDRGVDHGKLHGNAALLTGLLKQGLGFDGFVVSDWNGIGQLPGCTPARCAAAINAGIDMVMVPVLWREFIANTLAQVRAGEIPLARIDDAVARILRVKLRAGLFEHAPARDAGAGNDAALVDRTLARRAVRESLVLLKHDRTVLPLARGARVLVVGRAADRLELQTGGWSLGWQGRGNRNDEFPAGQTVLGALRAALGDAQVTHSETGEGVDVAGHDAVVAVVGEAPYAEGEGDLAPPATLRHADRHPEDLAVLQRVAGHGRPVVTVLFSGRPLEVNELLDLSDAFVAAWLPGTEGGGVADLLLRAADGSVAHDFRGRLPFAWPRSACPSARGHGAPLFARGHGLRVAQRTRLGRVAATPHAGCAAPARSPLSFLTAR